MYNFLGDFIRSIDGDDEDYILDHRQCFHRSDHMLDPRNLDV